MNQAAQGLLGDSAYTAFRAYQASLPARSAVDLISAILPAGAPPFSPAQADSLVAIISQGQPRSTLASSILDNLLRDVPAPITEADIEVASGLLAAHFAAMQAAHRQQQLESSLLEILYP